MNICDINHKVVARKRARRIGRGAGSGSGKTAGRGQQGLGARTGGNFLRGYVGGQTQLKNRFPKRGFNNAEFADVYAPVNVATLSERFADGETVSPDTLNQKGVTVRRGDMIKILGTGDCAKKLTVQAHKFSASAKAKIEKAGGTIQMIAAGKGGHV
jgi:large subunit ribosomal protein L15